MKKLLIITNLFWVSLFLLSSFISKHDLSQELKSNYHLLDAKLAEQLMDNYKKNYIDIEKTTNESKTDNKEDARSVWFSLEKLEGFIHDAKLLAGNDSKTGKPITNGIRFYYIQYPDKKEWNDDKSSYLNDNIDTKYENKHSIMLVPTFNDGINNVDFDPRYKDEPIASVFDNLQSKNTKKGNDAFIINAGTIVPPPYQILSFSKPLDVKKINYLGSDLMLRCDIKNVKISKKANNTDFE